VRLLDDWLQTYVEWASITEAPGIMHFWSAVCAISGALRRKVWIDRRTFKWYPSFYVILVAPPGIVTKSSTADLALDMLREIPGINFGPDIITWQSLVTAFAESCESFLYGEEYYPMSAITIVSSELGLLLNMQDRDMVNLLITLWDGRKQLGKRTKTQGRDLAEAPWITLLGCTTPPAIAENLPRLAVGGGFTSRCIFVYREQKERLIYDPSQEVVNEDWQTVRQALLRDLEHISLDLAGPFTETPSAREWEKAWYEDLWQHTYPECSSPIIKNFLGRKQTHLCKLAMILSVSRRDSMVLERADFETANEMLLSVEPDLEKVFALIGKSEATAGAERLVEYIKRRVTCYYEEAYNEIHSLFPNFSEFEQILAGTIHSGKVRLELNGQGRVLRYVGPNAVEGPPLGTVLPQNVNR